MIGVAVNPDDATVVAEFFELFKTPWELAVRGRTYSVIVSLGVSASGLEAPVILAYGSGREPDDAEWTLVERRSEVVELVWEQERIPIYGRLALFDRAAGRGTLLFEDRAADNRRCLSARVVWRVGYDLCHEVRHLLTRGQPREKASIPTLERHIALLRHLLLSCGVSFVEIPPRPAGFAFCCCLTHDLDFFGIRRHRLDRTLAGFIARASLGTLVGWLRGRRTVDDVRRNWAALLAIPLVFLGVRRDFWQPFDDYERVEAELPSTFFVVPFKQRPGVGPDGTIVRARAVSYQASDVRGDIHEALDRGREIATHGIDAWRDVEAGKVEMAELTSITGKSSTGVRMHWLYFDDESPRRLEEAGFEYDSSCGYNDAVGYRAGTSQPYRLFGTQALMELPLAIMDSALFYPGRMNLPASEADRLCTEIVDQATRSGGTVVVNWHDRSLAPERLWGRSYQQLIRGISNRPVWFATASSAVDWFRWRRAIQFQCEADDSVAIVAPTRPAGVPAARAVVHGLPGSLPTREFTVDGGGQLTVQMNHDRR